MFEAAKSDDREAVGKGLDFLRHLLGKQRLPFGYTIRFWDGTEWAPQPELASRFTLIIRHPHVLRKMFLRPNQLVLGEAYIYDELDVEGDMNAVFPLVEYLFSMHLGLVEKALCGKYLLALPSSRNVGTETRIARLKGSVHSRKRDRNAVTYHYDVSNDFYRLWLDERMVYSCAYFTSAGDSLDDAQERKLDYICRKLRLKKGDRLLDIGCGWGGLVMHAARNYGAQALGVTLSSPQAELARERFGIAGLQDSCQVEVTDYRDVDEREGYDKIVSVGMFEHVGQSRLQEYFSKVWRLLRPGGVFLNHGIGGSLNHPFVEGPSFMDKYVFPDGELLPISETLETAEKCGFDVRDLENLREHYERTLQHWIRRLESHHDDACRFTDEVTYRIWRLYMAGSAHAFKIGRMNLYQALFAKPVDGDSRIPLTRSDWYH